MRGDNSINPFGPEDILELLLEKLSRRGVLLLQVPRFIKDVMNIITENRYLAQSVVNHRLVRLGWDERILDGYVLELIRFLSESDANPYSRGTLPFAGSQSKVGITGENRVH
ncbi:MAG: hypothetical protein C4576_15850 [Desulfobacteraceae bacterium]|nr:MAG: hypothetical protein C4576_15850 [Desulfobacteraceae bacterium]